MDLKMTTRKVRVALIISLLLVMIVSFVANIFVKNNETESTTNQVLDVVQDDLKRLRQLRNDSASLGSQEKPIADEKFVTIDGTDGDGTIITPINLWSNYQTRSFAGKVNHGERVKLIRRDGDGVLIETKTGLQGWVTYFFIKEYK
jgi:hypothetical protein